MSSIINLSGIDLSDITAIASAVLSGYSFIDQNGDLVAGTAQSYSQGYSAGNTAGYQSGFNAGKASVPFPEVSGGDFSFSRVYAGESGEVPWTYAGSNMWYLGSVYATAYGSYEFQDCGTRGGSVTVDGKGWSGDVFTFQWHKGPFKGRGRMNTGADRRPFGFKYIMTYPAQ